MNPSLSDSSYALGYTEAEHRRLIRQAAELNPLSERLFRDAGIATGHRVLELGSGMGDVSMLVARMVGSTGEVLGIERDLNSIKLAQSRARDAGLQNISFSQSDITQLQGRRLRGHRTLHLAICSESGCRRALSRCFSPARWRHRLSRSAVAAVHRSLAPLVVISRLRRSSTRYVPRFGRPDRSGTLASQRLHQSWTTGA